MSRSIDDWDGQGTAFVINDAIAYLDSLTLFFWQAPGDDLLGALRKSYRRRLIVKVYEVPGRSFTARRRRHRSKRWHVTIHQPEPETLARLSAIHRRFVVHAVHVAIDFLCPDPRQADLATAFLTRCLVQKWRRDQQCFLHQNTRYWSRNKRKPRNIALYGDRPSKTGLGACGHLELRFTSAAACKRAGVGELNALIREPDVMALLKRQAWLAFIDRQRLDRAVEKRARLNLHKTRRRWPSATVADVKNRLQPLLAVALQDEGYPLDENTIHKACSQKLWDCYPTFRSCLVRLDWTSFTTQPRWYGW